MTNIDRLPASQIADDVNRALQHSNILVITAPPGAGKSTLLPLTIHEGNKEGGRLLMLEPRRLAARSIAMRMASMRGENVGQSVGYRVRHESRVSARTEIEVLTEGILTRMLIDDATLDGVSTVIFDEFHERNLYTDEALALTLQVQQLLRPDLRIVIMSATIDADSICQALHAPCICCEGRCYPITDVRLSLESDDNDFSIDSVSHRMASAVRMAHHSHEGDLLAFLPGEAEIRRCQELLTDVLAPTVVCPLYGKLNPEEQQRAIAPAHNGERRVVLATPIAETSLTIQGVSIVIDSGLCRRPVFDAQTGLTHLQTMRISRDMATQRRGRAGRVQDGWYYPLWTLATEHRMDEARQPEILEADLTSLVLDMALWGEADIMQLPWLTLPPNAHVAQARQLLRLLGAVDDNGTVTRHGRELWRQPYHPRIAQMLLHAHNAQERKLAEQLAELLETGTTHLRHTALSAEAAPLLAVAYPERIAHQLPEGCGRYRLASGDNVCLEPDDALTACEWLSVAAVHVKPGGMGRIFLAAPLHDVQALRELMHDKINLSWDNKRGQVVAQQEWRIGQLLVESSPATDITLLQQQQTICQAARSNGSSMLDFNDAVQNLQRRVATVAQWHPELDLPDLSTDAVLLHPEDWLMPFLGRARSTAELRKIDLQQALWTLLSYAQQQAVDRLAPTHIVMPRGNRIRVEYRQGAEQPIVRVRLQECFGMLDTPAIDDGRHRVLMELLSPGFKPVQLTQDLRSFWQTTYFEVRKELRRRYPKHNWQDP